MLTAFENLPKRAPGVLSCNYRSNFLLTSPRRPLLWLFLVLCLLERAEMKHALSRVLRQARPTRRILKSQPFVWQRCYRCGTFGQHMTKFLDLAHSMTCPSGRVRMDG